MRRVQFHQTGRPDDVAECVEVSESRLTSADDVLVRVEAFPINPADLLVLCGVYPRDSAHPHLLGNECVGVVEAVGAAVRGLAPGDRVISLRTANWSEFLALPESDLAKIPAGIGVETAAGLKVNPATACLLLRDYAELTASDWAIQNAANSSVGRAAIEVAAHRGLRTINVVRRPDTVDELQSLGADYVIVDGEDLTERVGAILGGSNLRLAIDAVGGSASGRLAACLGCGGTQVAFGAMSGEPMRLDPGRVVFNDLRLRGFWLTRFLRATPRPAITALYDTVLDLARRSAFAPKLSGRFTCPTSRPLCVMPKGRVVVARRSSCSRRNEQFAGKRRTSREINHDSQEDTPFHDLSCCIGRQRRKDRLLV